jgi:hypothetical protein
MTKITVANQWPKLGTYGGHMKTNLSNRTVREIKLYAGVVLTLISLAISFFITTGINQELMTSLSFIAAVYTYRLTPKTK